MVLKPRGGARFIWTYLLSWMYYKIDSAALRTNKGLAGIMAEIKPKRKLRQEGPKWAFLH